jgi:hypothetical protein
MTRVCSGIHLQLKSPDSWYRVISTPVERKRMKTKVSRPVCSINEEHGGLVGCNGSLGWGCSSRKSL